MISDIGRWKWATLLAAAVLTAILLTTIMARGDTGVPHKKLFTGRWYQQVTGGDHGAWMTLTASQLSCDGDVFLCAMKWTSPSQAAVDDWNSQPTTVRFQIMPDQSLDYD